jgi:aconitate hydratase
MGVLPLQFEEGQSWQGLGLEGTESVTITGLSALTPRCDVTLTITSPDGHAKTISTLCRIDTLNELDYYRHGGILHYVLRHLVAG